MIKKRFQKKGLSEVVATLIMVAITVAVAGIVWLMVTTFVNTSTTSTTACYNLQGKITLNNDYTCYNDSASPKAIVFSVNVGDIPNVQDILVSISGAGNSETFKIAGDNATSGLEYLNGTWPVTAPPENHGLTYIYPLPSSFVGVPQEIEIAPIISGNTCDVTDSIKQFDSCSTLSSI